MAWLVSAFSAPPRATTPQNFLTRKRSVREAENVLTNRIMTGGRSRSEQKQIESVLFEVFEVEIEGHQAQSSAQRKSGQIGVHPHLG